MSSILWFRDIHKGDIPVVGGKGANLGEIANSGFPVPNGFVVTSKAYFDFIDETGLKQQILRRVSEINPESEKDLEQASAEIKGWIMSGKMPEKLQTEITIAYKKLGERMIGPMLTKEETFVAVRSSATAEDLPNASFAGQQETFLNVRGKENVLVAVQKCWASLFTPRAIYYRRRQGFGTEGIGLAAVVQRMVNSEASGIIFTANPTTSDLSQIIVEACFGLGEAIVSGSITPDTFTIEKNSLRIIKKQIGKQDWKLVKSGSENKKIMLSEAQAVSQKVSDEKARELASIAREIEKHYGGIPQDIEFAIETGKIYVVQSRQITTLTAGEKEKSLQKVETTSARQILKGLSASPGIASGKAVIAMEIKDAGKILKGDVLVTRMTAPDWVPTMEKASAIVTNEGGSTCHAAIVSRELGIPCVVGTGNATELLRNGQIITVDGTSGIIYEGNVGGKEKAGEEKREEKTVGRKAGKKIEIEKIPEKELKEIERDVEELERKPVIVSMKEPQIITMKRGITEQELREHLTELLGVRLVKVKVNVALPEAAEKAAETNADGVGLLRAEHMITSEGIHPAEYLREGKKYELIKVIKQGIRNVAERFRRKPVWYRTFDARSDEYRNLKGGESEPKEDNPMLGWHGIRRSIDEPELLKAEFLAIKDLAKEGLNNVGIMLPFVQAADEIVKAKAIAKSVGLELGKDCAFGIMIETPAAAWIIDDLIDEGIQFVSFGTNDLTQLTLGMDRNNVKVQKCFTELHPAILKQLKYVIDKCNERGI
ncbi:MAG: phosphoenolpyruvate synthase, partial [archaeon]